MGTSSQVEKLVMKSNTEKVLASFLSRGISTSYSKGSPVLSIEKDCIDPGNIADLKREIELETDIRMNWYKSDPRKYYIHPEAK